MSDLEVGLAGFQYPGGAEEHGDVGVVAAGVHPAGDLALVLPLHRLLRAEQRKKGRSRAGEDDEDEQV